MLGRGLVPLVALGAVLSMPAPVAYAGSYTVNACLDDAHGANLSWASASSNVDLPSYAAGCSGSAPDGLIARAAAKPGGGSVPAFASSSWQFNAPAGTTIDRADLSLRMYRFGGGLTDRWGVGIGDETGAYLLGGMGQSALSTGARGSYFAVPVPNRTSLRLGVVCANGGGCTVQATDVAGAGYSRARTDLYGARVRISDPSAATLSGQGGALWTSSAWLSGTQALSFSATDNVGIALLTADLGSDRRVERSDCDFARTIPCPSSRQLSTSFDTTALSDGSHSVTIEATDSAGNLKSDSHTVLVDNTAPAAPGAPELAGAAAARWRNVNAFTLSYSNPSKASGAPLSSHDVQICGLRSDDSVDPSRCYVEARVGVPGLDAITVPAAGRFKMRVRVNDELFSGHWSPWSPRLLFDDTLPGMPVVAFPSGWVNLERATNPLVLAAPIALPTPPSGYSAYRVSVDRGPAITVAADGKADSGLFALKTLADGHHQLEIVAVTGAGLATPALSASVGQLEKDVVAPELAVSGAPTSGAIVPSTVTFVIRASDATSGMAAAVPPAPTGTGGYVATQLGRAAADLTGGPFAQLSPGEGQQLVHLFAADVAGNKSAVQSFAYTQDTKLPSGGLRPISAQHPALLDFFIAERCLGSASIEISTSPGVWRPLATSEDSQRASALVPAEVWAPRTPYSARATVRDCGGNSAILTDWYGGDRSGTAIGTIVPPPRAATSAKSEVAPIASGSSASALALRRVTSVVRNGSGDPLVGVDVRFETEPWMTPAQWEPAGSAKTDADGRATAKLAAHSSIRIRTVVPGNELRHDAISNTVYATRLASTTVGASPRTVRAGRTTTIKGRLRGGWVPRSGFAVTLYGRGPRSRGWVPIRTNVAVSSGGYWRARYRFLRSSRGKFYFLVRTSNRPDYPFRGASSQSVRVVVR